MTAISCVRVGPRLLTLCLIGLFQDLEECFMNSLHLVLDERFTDTLQENYRLLYGFVKSNIPQQGA